MADTITIFLQSSLGVTLQIIGIIGATIPAIKYFNSKFDKRIENDIEKRLNPIILKLCKDLNELINKLEKYEIGNDTTIKFLKERIERLENITYKRNDSNWKSG